MASLTTVNRKAKKKGFSVRKRTVNRSTHYTIEKHRAIYAKKDTLREVLEWLNNQ